MKVLLVGSGAREHVIAENVAKGGAKLYSVLTNRNPGILKVSEDYKLCKFDDLEAVRKFALKNDISMAIVGPEAPLANGMVDALISEGIDCVGPRKTLARLESDKAFCRTLMAEYSIGGCPRFEIFTDASKSDAFIDSSGEEWVIKPAGLTGGKGVKVMGEHVDKDAAKAYARDIIERKVGGMPKVVIEEKLVGEEFTLQCFTDGTTVSPMPAVQDHKRAYEGDEGPNTGGMGSYSDSNHLLPFLPKSDYDASVNIIEDTVAALKDMTNFDYKGIIYGQFMLTKSGPKVIEFNVRFGDPEAMNVLPLLESEPLDIYYKMAHGELKSADVKFKKAATVCKYLVPNGYPTEPKPTTLSVNDSAISKLGALLYFASVSAKNHRISTSTSRAAAVVGISDSLDSAERIAESAISHIKGDLFHRKDIGTADLIKRRVDHMRELR